MDPTPAWPHHAKNSLTACAYARRVFGLRMLEAKNSRKRMPARSPAATTSVGVWMPLDATSWFMARPALRLPARRRCPTDGSPARSFRSLRAVYRSARCDVSADSCTSRSPLQRLPTELPVHLHPWWHLSGGQYSWQKPSGSSAPRDLLAAHRQRPAPQSQPPASLRTPRSDTLRA